MAMSKQRVQQQVAAIEEAMDRMDRGMYAGLTIGYMADRIAWLWKYRHIDHDTMERLALHLTAIIGGETCA